MKLKESVKWSCGMGNVSRTIKRAGNYDSFSCRPLFLVFSSMLVVENQSKEVSVTERV